MYGAVALNLDGERTLASPAKIPSGSRFRGAVPRIIDGTLIMPEAGQLPF